MGFAAARPCHRLLRGRGRLRLGQRLGRCTEPRGGLGPGLFGRRLWKRHQRLGGTALELRGGEWLRSMVNHGEMNRSTGYKVNKWLMMVLYGTNDGLITMLNKYG